MKMLLLLLISPFLVFAQEQFFFSSASKKAQFLHLTQDLRCMVCQHQNLAESDAPLAKDMKQYIYEQIQQGVSDQDIEQYLVDRYGDMIRFKPPFKPITWFLWLAPVLMLIGGIALFLRLVKT